MPAPAAASSTSTSCQALGLRGPDSPGAAPRLTSSARCRASTAARPLRRRRRRPGAGSPRPTMAAAACSSVQSGEAKTTRSSGERRPVRCRDPGRRRGVRGCRARSGCRCPERSGSMTTAAPTRWADIIRAASRSVCAGPTRQDDLGHPVPYLHAGSLPRGGGVAGVADRLCICDYCLSSIRPLAAAGQVRGRSRRGSGRARREQPSTSLVQQPVGADRAAAVGPGCRPGR